MTLQEILRAKDKCGGCKRQHIDVYALRCVECLNEQEDNYELDKSLKELEAKADKWDEFKRPKSVVLGDTEFCTFGEDDFGSTTVLNCPNCNEAVGESTDDAYNIWVIHCQNCGQMIEVLSEEEIDRLNKLFEEREKDEK